jgi:tRNA threonylcarbamoyladenosine biosynthesis protein TsaE
MEDFQLVMTKEFDLTQIESVARSLKDVFSIEDSHKVVWFHGDLGLGKTTVIREILYQAGLPRSVKVLSPTFTYASEYSIGSRRFIHVDLYRLDRVDEVSWDSLLDVSTVDVIFIEWPERFSTEDVCAPGFKVYLDSLENERRLIKVYKRGQF